MASENWLTTAPANESLTYIALGYMYSTYGTGGSSSNSNFRGYSPDSSYSSQRPYITLIYDTSKARIYTNGAWETAVPYVYHNGVWQPAQIKLYDGGWN